MTDRELREGLCRYRQLGQTLEKIRKKAESATLQGKRFQHTNTRGPTKLEGGDTVRFSVTHESRQHCNTELRQTVAEEVRWDLLAGYLEVMVLCGSCNHIGVRCVFTTLYNKH